MKIVATHIRTGTKYVYAKEVSGKLVEVSTLKGWPQKWLVYKHDVKFV